VWGKPTCVNNVETLCNVPAIVANGNDWYKSLAREGSEDHGTKLMGFSGKVKNPGLWELPFGVTARELFEDYAGGMRDGFKLRPGSQAAPVPASCCPSTSMHRCTPAASPRSAPVWVPAWPWRWTTASTWFAAAQHGRVLRPRIVRLVHPMP
jgi:NADH-quinone oxidoreductase subunit F